VKCDKLTLKPTTKLSADFGMAVGSDLACGSVKVIRFPQSLSNALTVLWRIQF